MEPEVLHAGNPGPFTLDGTRTHLVGRREIAVVDPGPDVQAHVRALLHLLTDASRVTILVTHGHRDHAGAAQALSEATGSPVLGAAPGALPLGDGAVIPTDQGELVAIHTPGHTREHLAFLHPDSGTLFPGDLLLGQGDTTWVGSYPGSVSDYLHSLDRLGGLGLRRLLPAHGPPLEDPAEAIARFRRHRLDRIRQVEHLLEPGLRQVDRAEEDWLLREVYGRSLPAAVEPAARFSLRALLHHLGVGVSAGWGQGGELEEETKGTT